MRVLTYILLIITFSNFGQSYQYLGEYNSNGTPFYLETENSIINSQSIELLNNSLHSSLYIPTYYPNFFTSGYDTDISLNCETEIFITFIKEYASYNNSLGFYTYPTGSPPENTPANEDITIIFPHLSGDDSVLSMGNKVSLGFFPADTSIGFVLISNGWNGVEVNNGIWKLFTTRQLNTDLENDKNHQNILINDLNNESVILSFEDIKRNYESCDDDFNDAIFFVSSSNYNCLNTTNFIENCTSTQVSTAHNGGLESNGDLAHLIASRNINRLNNSQPPPVGLTDELECFFPQLGVKNETAINVTPYDLTNYSNAVSVYGVDYFKYDIRFSAGLVMKTNEKVYNHKKSICDRLNGGKIIDIRNVTIKNHNVILTITETANGEKEYSVHFSVRTKASVYEVLSYWDIEDYPCVDFYNFQIWGKDMTQVSHIVNFIFDKFEDEKKLVSTDTNKLPEVFVTAATYRNKKIYFDIINKNKSEYIDLNLTYRSTELSEPITYNETLLLNKEYKQSVVLDTEYMYDVSVSLIGENSNNIDKLYISDGPWGYQNDNNNNIINNYIVNEQETIINDDNYQTERNFSANGFNTDNVMFFKNILSGDKSIDISNVNSISLELTNNKPIEIILIHDNLNNWNNKLTYIINESHQNEIVTVSLNDFTTNNQSSRSVTNTPLSSNLKSVVFSVKGNSQLPESFDLSIKKLSFINNVLNNDNEQVNNQKHNKAVNYPNPFNNKTTFIIPKQLSKGNITIYDIHGKILLKSNIVMKNDLLTFDFYKNNLSNGVYLYKISDINDNNYTGKFIIN